jgi:uracil-DNA glycosylase family 4
MGTGSYRKPVFIVGEAPGFQEDQMGRPFVGRSGKFLRTELLRTEINPEQLYLTNTVKCFPDRTPSEKESETCATKYLVQEIRELNPEWILTLGSPAFKTITKSSESITEARGKVWDCKLSPGPLVFPTYHPAFILRRKDHLTTFRLDLELFAAVLDL